MTLKEKQLRIINKYNPITDVYHTGVRNIKDIKTFSEAVTDEESFYNGDFTKEDALKCLQNNSVVVYSSHPIDQGVFVSTSQNMAKDYSGNNKIYKKMVKLNEVAWINGDEGQYANTRQ